MTPRQTVHEVFPHTAFLNLNTTIGGMELSKHPEQIHAFTKPSLDNTRLVHSLNHRGQQRPFPPSISCCILIMSNMASSDSAAPTLYFLYDAACRERHLPTLFHFVSLYEKSFYSGSLPVQLARVSPGGSFGQVPSCLCLLMSPLTPRRCTMPFFSALSIAF